MAMAGGRSAVPRRVRDYDVLIGHCGKDCKRDFGELLRYDLERAGVRCFSDELSLEVGDVAADAMLNVMEEATYGVVLITPGFFETEWCMKEMETFKRRGRMVPVFLGSFAAIQAAVDEALAKGVWRNFKRFVRTEDDFRECVERVTEVSGVSLEEPGWWRSCIRRVRDELLNLLGKVWGGLKISEDELVVGQEEHLKELKKLLELPQDGVPVSSKARASQEVGEVGVKGMGGVGKTTLVKKLYDEPDVREWFSGGVCWLEVGAMPSGDKIRDLQRQLLKKLADVDEDPGNPTRGRERIRQRLTGKRVLICLDDVWEDVAMAPAVVNTGDLASGSRILKTSRVRESIGGRVYDIGILDEGPAWELFCWHAFGGKKPPQDLAEIAEKAASRCGGLPLALRVLGRRVGEAEDKRECLMTFLELPRESDAMIACVSSVRASYDRLPAEPRGLRDVFALVAGVWPRTPEFMELQRAVENLAAAVYGNVTPRDARCQLALHALDKLVSHSLVQLKEDGKSRKSYITVHELTVNVAERVWVAQRFFSQPLGEDTLRLPPYSSRLEHLSLRSGSVSIREVKSACSLIFGPGAEFVASISDESGSSPCRLLVMEKVRSVRLHSLGNLQCLRLSQGSFDRLPVRFDTLKDLFLLELVECKALKSLPGSIGALTGLTSLDLRCCEGLQTLPESVGALTGLSSLELSGCEALRSLPESVGMLKRLTSLDLSGCKALRSLPESVGMLTGLTSLYLDECVGLESLPESVGTLMEEGNSDMLFSLGYCYNTGTGVPKDEARAAELFAKAADQGHARGQCCLGLSYARGRGVEKDGGRAVKWMRAAAEQGHPAHEAALAELLMEGLGGAPNWVEALQLFESSLAILAPSKVTSAWMLWQGRNGVQQDRFRAKMMCEEVLTTEDLEDQLSDWGAVGWTWPAALKWFRSESWRAVKLGGKAVKRGEGESEALRLAEENRPTSSIFRRMFGRIFGRAPHRTPAHLEEGAPVGNPGSGTILSPSSTTTSVENAQQTRGRHSEACLRDVKLLLEGLEGVPENHENLYLAKAFFIKPEPAHSVTTRLTPERFTVDSQLPEGLMVNAYYPDSVDASTLEEVLREELASFWLDLSGFKLEFVPVASVLVHLEVLKKSERTFKELDSVLREASDKLQTTGRQPVPTYECDEDIFQLRQSAAGGWFLFFWPRPVINFVLYVAVKLENAGGSVKELVIVRGRNLNLPADSRLMWRVIEPGAPLREFDRMSNDGLRELEIEFLTRSPESVAVAFNTSVTDLVGKLVSIQWMGNVVEYGSPLKFFVPILSAPEALEVPGGTAEGTNPSIPRREDERGDTFLPILHRTVLDQARLGIGHGASVAQDFEATGPPSQCYSSIDWQCLVFISHAGPIKPFAVELEHDLTRLGFEAFLDVHTLHPGDDADRRMETCARSAPIGLVLFSRDFLKRKWPMRELEWIVGAETLLPVIVDMEYSEFKAAWAGSPEASRFDSAFFEKVHRTTSLVNDGGCRLSLRQQICLAVLRVFVKKVCPRLPDRKQSMTYIQRGLEAVRTIRSGQFGELRARHLNEAGTWEADLESLARN